MASRLLFAPVDRRIGAGPPPHRTTRRHASRGRRLQVRVCGP